MLMRTTVKAAILFALCVSPAAAARIDAIASSYTPFDQPIEVYDVSGDGAVLIGRPCPANADCAYAIFPEVVDWRTRWRGHTDFDFYQPQPGDTSDPIALSLSFDGSTAVGAGSDSRPRVWTKSGSFVPIVPGDHATGHGAALDVSDDGRVVVGTYQGEPFQWTETNGYRTLPGPPEHEELAAIGVSADGSTIVGGSTSLLSESLGVVWRDGRILSTIAVAGVDRTVAQAVSASGDVVAGTASTQQLNDGVSNSIFRWDALLGTKELGRGQFAGMTGDGETIVGNSNDGPVIWDRVNGMRSLTEVLSNEYRLQESLSGWQLTTVDGVSKDGSVLVGTGVGPNHQSGWIVHLQDSEQCDPNLDGRCDVGDIDFLASRTTDGSYSTGFDLNLDLRLDEEDRRILVEDLLGTRFGDATLDGVFDSTDLVSVFSAGEYEDSVGYNSTWSEGDWNGDLDFDSEDLIYAMARGGYTSAAVASVPEPRAVSVFSLIILFSFLRPRRR